MSCVGHIAYQLLNLNQKSSVLIVSIKNFIHKLTALFSCLFLKIINNIKYSGDDSEFIFLFEFLINNPLLLPICVIYVKDIIHSY